VKRVLTAVILIPLVILALFRAPLWLFTLLVLSVALLAAYEYLRIVKAQGFQPMATTSLVFLILVIVSYPFAAALGNIGIVSAMIGVPVLLCAAFVFLVLSLQLPTGQALPSAALSYMLLPYIGLTLGVLPFLRARSFGSLFVLYLMLLVWCGDVAAYYVGRAIGKHKLAPRISPGKTWEGSIASVAGAVIVGILLFRFVNPIADAFRSAHLLKLPPVLPAMSSIPISSASQNSPALLPVAPIGLVAVFAICINIAAQLGDLVESALKRGAGLKDSGTLLPGHGGVLDRIDALLFALPVGLLFYVWGMSRYFEPSGPR